MVDTGGSCGLREVLLERLIIEIAGQAIAGVLARSIFLVLESRVASPGHLRCEMQPMHGGILSKTAQGRASVARGYTYLGTGQFANLEQNPNCADFGHFFGSQELVRTDCQTVGFVFGGF